MNSLEFRFEWERAIVKNYPIHLRVNGRPAIPGFTYLLASACGDIYEAIEKAAKNQFGPDVKVVEHADGTIGLLGAHFPDSKSLKLKGEVDFVIMDFSAVLKGEKDE